MFFEPTQKNIISFSDDSSVDSRKTNLEKVSIYADVIKEKPFDWFNKILSFQLDPTLEFKSKDFNEKYLRLSNEARKYINETLKFVRVNIFDPREFTGYIDQAIREIIPNVDPKAFLEKLKRENNELANKIIASDLEFRAKKLIDSLPSNQLRNSINFYQNLFQLDLWGRDIQKEEGFDLEPFRKNKIVRLNELSVYASKSSAVFNSAIEEVGKFPYFANPMILKIAASSRISSSYAYDIGNNNYTKQIENERIRLMKEFNPYQIIDSKKIDPIIEIDSSESVFIQGADLAAGIVRILLEERGFAEVKSVFESVYYNGRKLSIEESISLDRKYPILKTFIT